MTSNIEVAKETRLEKLAGILILFMSIWGAIFVMILKVIDNEIYVEGMPQPILSLALTFVSFYVIRYIFQIIRAIYFDVLYEAKSRIPEVHQNDLLEKKTDVYYFVTLGWINQVFLVLFAILLFSLLQVFGLNIYGYIASILLALCYICVFHQLINKDILKKEHQGWKTYWNALKDVFTNQKKKLSLDAFKDLLLLIIYFCLILMVTTHIDITFDREFYSIESQDFVYAKIEPKGVIRPDIAMVIYSNEAYVLFNGTDKPYTKSALIVGIPVNISQPRLYNSYIIINYRYFKSSKIPYIRDLGAIWTESVPYYNATIVLSEVTPFEKKNESTSACLQQRNNTDFSVN